MRRLLVLSLAAFGAATTIAAAAPPHAQVAVRSTTLGTVLVDARGHTLYVFDQDRGGKSACAAGCTSSWPPFLTSGAPVALKGVQASLVGTTRRSDGKLQVTFAHRPLYFFAHDAKAGQVNGAAIAHWAALAPTGAKLRAKSTGSTSTNPAPAPPPVYGGGDGY
jgi:predicted lipoprotein with Yx(FWY)xxD motif